MRKPIRPPPTSAPRCRSSKRRCAITTPVPSTACERSCRSPKSIAFPPPRPTMSAASKRLSQPATLDPKGVIAVLGKTEGNGLVNDFARGYASLALSLLFQRHLPKPEADKICLVMSGGTEGGMAPHWTVFERAEGNGAAGPALAIGRAHTAALPCGASRPAGAGRGGRGRRARGDGRRRHRRSGRRAFRPGQMPAADRGARRRGGGARRQCRDARHAEVHGPVARRQRARCCRGPGRNRARSAARRGHRHGLGPLFRPRQLLRRRRIARP